MNVFSRERSMSSTACLVDTGVIFSFQKAIKEKNIPIDNVEFMGPNKEKPGSWCDFEPSFFWITGGEIILDCTDDVRIVRDWLTIEGFFWVRSETV